MQNASQAENIVYLKEHQAKLIELEAESLAKAALKRINERWLIEGADKRDLAIQLFIKKFNELC